MGVYLSQPITSKKIQEGGTSPFNFCCGQMQGWRKSMEDAAIHKLNLGDGNHLFGVFDGHGGTQVSKYVEQHFIDILLKSQSYKSKKYSQSLDQSFKKMDEMILRPQACKQLNSQRGVNPESDPISNNTGCTANVILITPDKYYIANAGDSRSVLCNNGKAIDFSEDHKPESQIESNRIKKAGGQVIMGRVNGGLNLTRSFGDFDYKKNPNMNYADQMITCKPDVKQFLRQKGDEFILMGCDGIWQKYVNDSQGLIDIVRSKINQKLDNRTIVEQILDELIAKDTSQGVGCDNMTAILIRIV